MSPLLSKALNVPANLDGRFLINVNFCKRETQIEGDPLMEQRIIEVIQNDLDGIGIGKAGGNNKRRNKQNFKQGGTTFDEKQAVKSGGNRGAEQLVQQIAKLHLTLLKDISIYEHEISKIDLNQLLSVEC
jgi:hypothetical protein